MLTRGQNLVGYKHYSREIVNRFIKASKRNGVHVFRVFDALNDIRNVVDTAEAVNECGGHFEGAISYTISPVHTLDSYLEYAQQLKELGADSICVKDMAGLMTPYRAERIVKALNAEIGLPVHHALPLRRRHGPGKLPQGRRGGRVHRRHAHLLRWHSATPSPPSR